MRILDSGHDLHKFHIISSLTLYFLFYDLHNRVSAHSQTNHEIDKKIYIKNKK